MKTLFWYSVMKIVALNDTWENSDLQESLINILGSYISYCLPFHDQDSFFSSIVLLQYYVSVTTERLAEDLELFAHHAGRKSVNMNDVILSGMPIKPSSGDNFDPFSFKLVNLLYVLSLTGQRVKAKRFN